MRHQDLQLFKGNLIQPMQEMIKLMSLSEPGESMDSSLKEHAVNSL
jgi:hypothetical protein